MTVRVAILTVSDGCAHGSREDKSGQRIVDWSNECGFTVAARAVVPDESDEIVGRLIAWADHDAADLILTTGGTGLGPRDVTPEATRAAIQREAPGIAEAIRFVGYQKFPRSALSRGIAGTRGTTLIVNLPGSPGGVNDGLAVLAPILQHAVEILRDVPTDH